MGELHDPYLVFKETKRRKWLGRCEKQFKKKQYMEPDEKIMDVFTEAVTHNEDVHYEEGAFNLTAQGIIQLHHLDDYFEIYKFRQATLNNQKNEARVNWCAVERIDPVVFDLDVQTLQSATVNTMYKPVSRKVLPLATPLPISSIERIERSRQEPPLRMAKDIGHKFTDESLKLLRIGDDGLLTEDEKFLFQQTIKKHGKAFAFNDSEIGCANPEIIPPMIIFTMPHVPWKFKPIPVPKAHYDALLELLRNRMKSRVIEASTSPYSSRWFTVPKKNGKLRFIQDLQPVNRVTIRDTGTAPLIHEYVDEFCRRSILSIGDLYSGYDQFQLERHSRQITAIRTPLGLVQMATCPQGGTNSVAHVTTAMGNLLQSLSNITRPFIDDLPMRGCPYETKDESEIRPGLRRFVVDHINDVDRVLSQLESAGLTLNGEKSFFGIREILLVGFICNEHGKKPDPKKVNALDKITACKNVSDVRRFLGAAGFFRDFIPRYAEIAEPLYACLRKENTWNWTTECASALKTIKTTLTSAHILRPLRYGIRAGQIFLTVDGSPTAAGWVLSQMDDDGLRYPSKFGAKTFRGAQRNYGQTKRELLSVKTALMEEQQSILGVRIIVETDCKALLGMVENCTTLDLSCQRWLGVIKQFDIEFKHIAGADNKVADFLSRATFSDEPESSCNINTTTIHHRGANANDVNFQNNILFRSDEYEDEFKMIGLYLSRIMNQQSTKEASRRVRRQALKYFLKDGYLWVKPAYRDGGIPRRVVGKPEERLQILKELHDHPSAGHFGTERTYLKIRDRYAWPRMGRDVIKYVTTCEICQRNSRVRYFDPVTNVLPSTIFDTWFVDLITMPLIDGFRYVVLARESLSNYVEGRALRTKETAVIARFLLEDVISRYSGVRTIRADRGELSPLDIRQWFKRFGVHISLTTAYNPEANGKVERGHQSIIAALAKTSNNDSKSWPALLPFALWADRTTVHRTTGYTPHQLVFGERPMLPVENITFSWKTLPWTYPMSRTDLLALRIRQLEHRDEDRGAARLRVIDNRETENESTDNHRRQRPEKMETGDFVLMRDERILTSHNANRKFSSKWTGPYRVTNVHSDSATYSLEELDGSPLAVRTPGKRLKKFAIR